jgi:tetratricopeptide (TPR) repeat protein
VAWLVTDALRREVVRRGAATVQSRADEANRNGAVALAESNFDEAIRHFSAALAIDPANEVACNNLAWTAATHRSPDMALGALAGCAERFPGSALLAYALGAIQAMAGMSAEAERNLGAALDRHPEPKIEARILNEYARLLVAEGRPEEALTLLEARPPFPEGSEEGATLSKTHGVALLAAGKAGEAAPILDRALASGNLSVEASGEALLAAGRAHEELGEAATAARSYGEILRLGSWPEHEEEARQGLARLQAKLLPAGTK